MSKKKETKVKKESKIINTFIFLFLAISLALSGFAIFELCLLSSIENLLRYMAIAVLGCFDLFFILKFMGLGKKKKKRKGLLLFFFNNLFNYLFPNWWSYSLCLWTIK